MGNGSLVKLQHCVYEVAQFGEELKLLYDILSQAVDRIKTCANRLFWLQLDESAVVENIVRRLFKI
jgi:hypothetical protein